MASVSLSAKYRPLKIGFLIEEGHLPSLLEAVKINTLLWGGIYNPIIPVGTNTEEVVKLIDNASIDILHPITKSENISKILNEFPYLKSPHNFTYEMFREDWDTKQKTPAYLDSLHIIEKHYQKYFKGKPVEDNDSNCVLPKWSSQDPLSNVFNLMFGSYSNEFNLKDDFENAFLKGLRSKKIEINPQGEVDEILGGKIDPLILTSIDLRNYGRELFRDNGVFVGDINSFDDLIFFWNLRTTGLRIQFVPIIGYSRLIKYTKKHLEELATSRKKPDFHRSVNFYYRNREETSIDPIFNDIKISTVPSYKCNISNYSLSDILENLPLNYLSWETINGSVEKSHDKYVVNINLPIKKFIIDETERDTSKQGLVISLDFYGNFGFEGHTLKLPKISRLNEFYSREISFDPWKVRSEKDSLALLIELDDKNENLYPINNQELINKVFEYSGIKAKHSQAGLLTQEFINNMREHEPLEACRVFKIRGVRKLIKSLKVGRSIKYQEALKIVGKEEFGKYKGLFIESREEKDLTVQNVFDFLVKKRILKPKLRFLERLLIRKKEFRCKKCGLNSKIRCRAFESNWTCEYCEHLQYLPPFIPSEFNNRNPWSYLKRGLFGKENNQEGALPVILNLLVLKHSLNHGEFLYSTSLICGNCNKNPEIDFAILKFEKNIDNNIEIAFGECKSDGGEITKDDIEKMESVKEKFESKGINCHLIFAKTSDTFSSEEIKMFKELVTKHTSVILFTNKELETNHHLYWDDPDFNNLPFKHALNLRELAQNSSFRYLR